MASPSTRPSPRSTRRASPSTRWPEMGKLILPMLGAACVLLAWTVVSATIAPVLPSPARTWQESRRYVLEPFFKDGEMNQGIGRLAFYSLVRVAKGFALALAIGTPIGFLLGLSPRFHQSFDPIVQFMRPISPLAWLPLGLVIFQKSEPAGIFTIALCAMWPTVVVKTGGVDTTNHEDLKEVVPPALFKRREDAMCEVQHTQQLL